MHAKAGRSTSASRILGGARVAVIAALVTSGALFQGCGDSDQGTSSSGGSSGAGGTAGSAGDASLDGGSCKAAGETCAAPTECCTLVCDGGRCGASACVSDNQACTSSAQCCGGTCTNSLCRPLNPECKTAGNTCAGHGDCCSRYCSNGRCSGKPSYCAQTGDICSTDIECCTGICTKPSGSAVGTCGEPHSPGTTGCLIAGQVCGAGASGDGGVVRNDAGIPACGGECCSRSCAPYGPTGVLICQPPSGCRPTGEICRSDADCCGSPGMPGGNGSVRCSKSDGQPVGRCDNGNACRAAGAICKLATTSCNAENNCCAGNVNQNPAVCQQDLLGIPRCTGGGDCSEAGSRAGQPCATSTDCCGLPCVPNPNAGDGGAAFVCGTTCVPKDGACSTDADCCSGMPCKAPPGSTQGICGQIDIPDGGYDGGTCAFYGQQCTSRADCCNSVPCTNGRCVYPVN